MAIKSKKQKEIEEYLSRIKLHELFQVKKNYSSLYFYLNNSGWLILSQGLLHQVVIDQPEHPFEYFHDEIKKIKKEMEESNVRKSIIEINLYCLKGIQI